MKEFTFIDLFSGIGGFHLAMEQLGGKCVLASEIDKFCIETYKNNFGIDSGVNVRDLNASDVPDHDVLCAGFPCVAFSKAGKQEGFLDETRGTLFFDVERILRAKKPKFFILENVRNLVSHDKGNTWRVIKSHLLDCGYRLTETPLIVSPHYFGVPQLRERVVICGKYDPENTDKPLSIQLGQFQSKEENSIDTVLDYSNNEEDLLISADELKVLNAWDEFYHGIDLKIIGFPIWVEYFKKPENPDFPDWKKDFVRKNHLLYESNKEFIDKWMKKNEVDKWNDTQRKFEWQAGTSIDSVWEGLIQSRPSGLRVKKPNCFPALVAMVQIPIIGKLKRRLSVREAARLQSFPDSYIPCTNKQQAYKQFGNAVNVEVIKRCAIELFKTDGE